MKRIINSFCAWSKDNKAIYIAFIILLLCFGIMDRLIELINTSILLITDFERNLYLDWFFIIITLYACALILCKWVINFKIVTASTIAILVVPIVLYMYFRIDPDSPYLFTSYWNGPIAYVDGLLIPAFMFLILYVYQQFKAQYEPQNDDKYQFDKDAPICHRTDDKFNMSSLVKRIVNYIANTDIKDSAFSMGLIGEWGDGKTSLMKLIVEDIQTFHPEFIVIHFNPRASKKADFIQEDFLESLKGGLAKFHSGIERTIDKYAMSLDIIPNLPPLLLKILDLFRVRFDKDRNNQYEELKKAIGDINRRIVILIDDLDRLTGEELVEVMKIIDTNGDFPNIIFLTSFDKCYVNTVLNNYLNLGTQKRNYTDKYFTVEIRVPLHASFRIFNYLIEILKSACKTGFINMEESTLEKRTISLSDYITRRLHTIRDVKRFANQFLYDYAEIQQDVDYRDYVLLELIKYAYPEEYEAIYKFQYIHSVRASLFGRASEDLLYINKDLLPQEDKNGNKRGEPKIKPKSIDLLKELFPVEENYTEWYSNRYKRIYSVSSFEHYFYNYEYIHLKAVDIDKLYRTETIADACKIIDEWSNYAKDLETYMLTFDISSVKDQTILCRYMQILLYTGHKSRSINYWKQEFAFVRKEDVDDIIKTCGFESYDDYKSWLGESLTQLGNINPMIPSDYVRAILTAQFDNNMRSDLYVITIPELQSYALNFLKDYLENIGTAEWEVDNAYYMARIQKEKDGKFMPEAMNLLHDSMVNNFGKFSASLPFFAEDNLGVSVGYTLKFNFSSVFENKDEFEHLINAPENNEADQIKLVRAIWPFYKANNCKNFPLPEGFSIERAKNTLLKPLMSDLEKYEKINSEIDNLAKDWKKNPRLTKVDSYVKRAKIIKSELESISLELNKKEQYSIQIDDMIGEFNKYYNTARDLNKDTLRVGDIVRMKEGIFKKYYKEKPNNMIFCDNVFTVRHISATGQIMTNESNISLSFEDLEALLIDGDEDSMIYYEPKSMAAIVNHDEEIPLSETDYGYFMEAFKRCFDSENISYYDLVLKHGFQFVHEVQHWLNDEMHIYSCLKIDYSSRKGQVG